MRGGSELDQRLVKFTPLISTSCMFHEFTKLIVPDVSQQNSPMPLLAKGSVTIAGLPQGNVVDVTVIAAVAVKPPL